MASSEMSWQMKSESAPKVKKREITSLVKSFLNSSLKYKGKLKLFKC